MHTHTHLSLYAYGCRTSLYYQPFSQLQGVPENLCFFTIHCNPSLAYNFVRGFQSSQRNASLRSLHLATFFVQPIAAECWRGKGGKHNI